MGTLLERHHRAICVKDTTSKAGADKSVWIGFNWISTKHSPALVFATTLKMHKSVLLHFATTLLASSSAAFTFLTPSSARATTARHADAYSYTYGGAPPPQGGNGGPRTDESRVVRYNRWRSCEFVVTIPPS
jgi:hypothetical protein